MAARTKQKISGDTIRKARELLAFAERKSATAADWGELFDALFCVGGKAEELFSTASERRAFCRTKESRRIDSLLAKLPIPPPTETIHIRVNGELD